MRAVIKAICGRIDSARGRIAKTGPTAKKREMASKKKKRVRGKGGRRFLRSPSFTRGEVTPGKERRIRYGNR